MNNKKTKDVKLFKTKFEMDVSKLPKELLALENLPAVTQLMSITLDPKDDSDIIDLSINIKGDIQQNDFFNLELKYFIQLVEKKSPNREESREIIKEIFPQIRETINFLYKRSPFYTLEAPDF